MREIKRQFRHAVKCGLGSAYFIIRDNPTIDFSHDIIKASISNLAIDAQCEGDRAEYLVKLIDISRREKAIITRILTSLTDEQNDFWGCDQLFELAAIFALRGDRRARHAIYKRFRNNDKIRGSEGCGEDAIIKLDGFNGLVFIIKARGKKLLENNEYCTEDIIIKCFQDANPQIEVYAELEKAAAKSKSVRKYLDTIKKNKWPPRSARRRKQKYTYSKIKDNIEKVIMFPVPTHMIKNVITADIKKLADDFQKETNPGKQEKYLRIFAEVKYPNDYKAILDIAKSQYNGQYLLIEFACWALSHFKTDEIRQLALDKLRATTNPSDYLPLLISNYKKGDEVLLKEIATRSNDFDYIHSLARGYVAIYRKNKTKTCKEPLEILYQKMNCGIHRYEIVEILYDNNVLSEKIIKELEYDSYEDTRQFYANIMKKAENKTMEDNI